MTDRATDLAMWIGAAFAVAITAWIAMVIFLLCETHGYPSLVKGVYEISIQVG